MAHLSIRLFGPFEVQRDGQFLDDQAWRSRQNRTILQVLLSRRGNVVPADQLLDILWPETETNAARRRLHVRISQLRKTLDPQRLVDYIETVSGGYTFNAGAECWIDTEVFERQAERGHRAYEDGNTLEAITAFETARTLYRGDFLEENVYDGWTYAERERLRERCLVVLTELAECYAQLGRYRRAISTCHQILSADNSREAVYVRLMLYYYYAGERSEAIRTYDRCRQQLAEELDVSPLPDTRRLADRIRDGSLWSVPDGPRYPPPAFEGRLFAVPYSLSVPPFVGRDREYAWLVDRWQHMPSGLIAIHGATGTGKSRLVEEFLGHVAEKGAQVLRGYGRPGPSLPYSAVVAALAKHSQSWNLAELPESKIAALAPLLPTLASAFPDLPPLPDLPAVHEEERLLNSVSVLVRGKHPPGSVLFIDDAHLLDRPSINLLLRLAQAMTVVLAYRIDEPGTGSNLDLAFLPLQRQGLFAEIQLNSLPPQAVRQLIGDLAGREMPMLSNKVIDQTQGNPLFVLASLQHLFEEGVLYVDAGGKWAVASDFPLTLPPTTRHAISGRLNKLSRAQRQVLDLAAVVNTDFDFQLIWAASGLDEATLLEIVDTLLEAGLLIEPRTLDSRELALGHSVFGEVAYQTLPLIRRRHMHGRVAQALLENSTDLDLDAPALAHHFGQAGQEKQSASWFVQAGDGALARFAHEEALAFYQRALAQDVTSDGHVWLRMGVVARHLARYGEAAGYYERALTCWTRTGDPKQQIRCLYALAECYRELSDYQQAADHVQQGLSMASGLDDRPELVARGQIILSNAMRSGQLAPTVEVRSLLQQALALAKGAQAWQLMGEATFWLGVVAINQGDTTLALTHDRRAIRFFQRTKQTGWLAICYNNIAYHALLDGKPELALEQAKLGLELAREIGSLHTQSWLLSTLGEIQLYLDHLDDAEFTLEEGLALVNRWGPVRLKPGLLVDLARVAMARRAWDTAVAQIEAAKELAQDDAPQFMPRLEAYLAQAYLGQGRRKEALSAAGKALEAANDKSQHCVAGQAQRLLGQIYASGRRTALAMEAFGDSLERLLDIDDRVEGARTQAAWGNWLADMGDPAAGAMLQSARNVLEEAGASLYLRQMADGAHLKTSSYL